MNIGDHIYSYLLALEASPTLDINELSSTLIKNGRNVIKFGFGQSPFPIPGTIVKDLKVHAERKEYMPVQGLPGLRKKVADYLQKRSSLSFHADQILIGPGSKELLSVIQQSIDLPLILPSPSWVSYAPQAILHRKNVHWIDTRRTEWMLKADLLEQYCMSNQIQGALLLLNYPSNPTGRIAQDSDLQALAEIARKYRLVVISDEIYGELTFDHRYRTISTYYPEGTIVTSGLSKWCGAGGWRLGFAAIPEHQSQLMKTMCSIASETYSCVSTPTQYAAIRAFEIDEYSEFIDSCSEILSFASKLLTRTFKQLDISCIEAQGGFYLFPSFEKYESFFSGLGISGDSEMCTYFLEELGIALLPGSVFGRDPGEWSCRLAFVDFDGKKALKVYNESSGIKEDEFAKAAFSKILNAIDQFENWHQHTRLSMKSKNLNMKNRYLKSVALITLISLSLSAGWAEHGTISDLRWMKWNLGLLTFFQKIIGLFLLRMIDGQQFPLTLQ